MTEVFDKYVSNYDIGNIKIKSKYDHSYRVMNLSKEYAIKLGFNEHDVELATLIGLLHDFGRFEQFRIYHSFNDLETIDHADYSVEQLFDKGRIKDYYNNEDDYELIKFAIKNHNKFSIPDVNDERMLMHAKLIRDADKIDIIYLMGNKDEYDSTVINEPITKEVLECIKQHKTINREYCKNKNDRIAVYFAFVFDINNDVCLEKLKEYYKTYYKKLNSKEIFEEVYEEVIKYIDERIDSNARD